MINYQIFLFSCPPRTGTAWFIKAAQYAGLGVGFKVHAHIPFRSELKTQNRLRVTLVRHPCDWLTSCYFAIVRDEINSDLMNTFGTLNVSSFYQFVRAYLHKMSGAIGDLYNRYEADSCLRIEDMPWALIELLETLEVPESMRKRVALVEKQNVSAYVPWWEPGLKQRVKEAEKGIMDAYEYT